MKIHQYLSTIMLTASCFYGFSGVLFAGDAESDPKHWRTPSLEEIYEYFESDKIEDRIFAAEYVLDRDPLQTPNELLWKALRDKDKRVRIEGLKSVGWFAESSAISDEEAKKLCSVIEKEYNIGIGRSNEFWKTRGEYDMTSLVEAADALDELYFRHSLVSPLQYENWQINELTGLVRVLWGRVQGGEENEGFDNVLRMINTLEVPAALDSVLPDIWSEIGKLSSEQKASFFLVLCNHRVVGVEAPFAVYLKELLQPTLETLTEELQAGDTAEANSVRYWLNQIGSR